MPFKFERADLEGLIIIEPSVYADERGFLLESFKTSQFSKVGIGPVFVQDNMSFSKKNVLRGLHFQRPPYAQGKLVYVVKGKIWDVAVDIRKKSQTFGRWFGIELSEENHRMLWIPEGFAHGFLSLEDNSIVQYKCTKEYNQASELGIRYNDPTLSIDWPSKEKLIVSKKDNSLPYLKEIVEELS